MKYIIRFLLSTLVLLIVVYFTAGFYVAYQILKIDPTCGLHEGSLPNSWSTKVDAHEYSILAQQKIRENFNFKDYYLDEWQDVYFQSRDSDIKINGWLFNYFPNRPIIIVTHGISPNGKCKSESNLIASFLVNKNFNVLSIDLPGHGNSEGPCLDSIEKISEWLEKVFEKLNLDSLIIVGHSQGCLEALELSLIHI